MCRIRRLSNGPVRSIGPAELRKSSRLTHCFGMVVIRYELPDVIDAVSQLRAEQQKLAADMSQGFQAISDRLDTLASR